jgi:putative flippase GtrA
MLAKALSSRANLQEFWRYFCAGCLTFFADLAVLAALAEGFGVHYLVANAASVIVGISIGYWLCIKWVFTYRKFSRVAVEIPMFIVLSLVGLVINEALLWLCVAGFSLHYLLAKILVTAVVFILNYVMKKTALFS